jgi:hypothetical protein
MKEEQKEEQTPKKKHIAIRILNVIIWLVLFVCLSIAAIDYINLINENEPQFCLKRETIKYDDGNEYYCKGILYETYIYERDSKKGYSFIPFWKKFIK